MPDPWFSAETARMFALLSFLALLAAGGMTFVLMLYYDWRILRLYRRAELHRSIASDL